MKGTFTLTIKDMYVYFGNLLGDGQEIGYLDGEISGRLLAHDVLEHSVVHRKKSYVTWEEEFRALGAVQATRYADITHDITIMLEHLDRPLKNPPHHYKDTSLNFLDLCEEAAENLGVPRSQMLRMARNIQYGYMNKAMQWDKLNERGQYAFEWLESQADRISAWISDTHWDVGSTGVTCSFDTINRKLNIRNRYI